MAKDCYPEPNTKVHFYSATGFVRSGYIRKQPVSGATSKHGKQVAILDDGYILINQAWGIKDTEKTTALSKEQIAEWKSKRKPRKK